MLSLLITSIETNVIGTTAKLGLQFPISATSDVLQVSKRVANGYDIITFTQSDDVDATYSTINLTITEGDSFEVAALASQ